MKRIQHAALSIPLALAVAALLTVGCGGYDNDSDWQEQKQSMRQDIEASMSSLEDNIDELETQLAEADRESRERIESQIDELQRQDRELEEAMSEIADQTEATWDEWSREVQAVIDGQDS